MRVALLQCPVWGTREPPLAVVQLAGCLKSKGHDVRSFDLNNHLYHRRNEYFKNLWAWEQSLFWYNREEVRNFFSDIRQQLEVFADQLLNDDPRVVGFSVAASSYAASIEFARIVHARNPAAVIVFGGTVFNDERYIASSFNDAPVSYVIKGEADITLPELVACLESGGDVSRCAGIYLNDAAGVRFTGDRPLVENLDALPYMDFDDLKAEAYDDNEHILMMASRGCVWNCTFCSSRYFWKGYRAMSGERVHQEVVYHRARNRTLGHIDFADLAFNGDMKRVQEFSSLMVQYPPYDPDSKMYWVANAVITPQLTPDVLEVMKAGGCKRLIFGIESGSERVLKLMRKGYRPEVAKKVLKDIYEAGIAVTLNFMFGFPGETEEDFQQTLDFIKSVAGYVGRVYPSRTYCAIEEYSYFYQHPEEFGIKTPFNHHLYWETTDGTNTYPVRLERCRRFEELCQELKVDVDCGVKTSVELDKWFSLGMYYEYKNDCGKMMECYHNYLQLDPHNKVIRGRALELLKQPAIKKQWGNMFDTGSALSLPPDQKR